jgi:hypothetical protein
VDHAGDILRHRTRIPAHSRFLQCRIVTHLWWTLVFTATDCLRWVSRGDRTINQMDSCGISPTGSCKSICASQRKVESAPLEPVRRFVSDETALLQFFRRRDFFKRNVSDRQAAMSLLGATINAHRRVEAP